MEDYHKILTQNVKVNNIVVKISRIFIYDSYTPQPYSFGTVHNISVNNRKRWLRHKITRNKLLLFLE